MAKEICTLRKVAGSTEDGPGDIAHLAFCVVETARSLGLRTEMPKCSRSRNHTASRYIEVKDRLGRIWHLRISDHYRPRRSPYAPPHFDLVALDGHSGLGEARSFLEAVSEGRRDWTDHSHAGRRPRRKARPNFKRFKHAEGRS